MSETVVIVGAGQAAGQLAVSLRGGGYPGMIVLLGEEPHPPYQRPPLSKHLLAGDVGRERAFLKPDGFYAEADIELRPKTRVESLDRAAKTVTLAGGEGELVRYDRLVLATGSRVRTLDLPGSGLAGIHYLRTLADMEAIQTQLQPGASLVVVGGGYIGLEVAAVAVAKGLKVTVLEAAGQLMPRVVGPQIAEFYAAVHRQQGVDIRTGTAVSGFAGEGRVNQVNCADGSTLDADFVVVGVGILPNVELAEAAGLACDNGIVVDEYCVTSDPAVLAIGDCTSTPCARYDRRVRLESVPNALAQARAAAATLGGQPKANTEVPWFWSDQYKYKLQMVGFSAGHDQVVVRGTPGEPPFMVCYLQNGELLAVESVNNPREFMTCRQLVASRAKIDAKKLADSGVGLIPITPTG